VLRIPVADCDVWLAEIRTTEREARAYRHFLIYRAVERLVMTGRRS
jgi:hypothetical protein